MISRTIGDFSDLEHVTFLISKHISFTPIIWKMCDVIFGCIISTKLALMQKSIPHLFKLLFTSRPSNSDSCNKCIFKWSSYFFCLLSTVKNVKCLAWSKKKSWKIDIKQFHTRPLVINLLKKNILYFPLHFVPFV